MLASRTACAPRTCDRVLWTLLLLVVFVGCRGEREVRSHVASADRERLIADAAAIHRRYAGRTRFDRDVPRPEWPASFAVFVPERVSVDRFGVYIQTHSMFVETAGLFIRVDPAYAPPAGGDPGFESIDGPFFWYYAPG